MILRRGNLEVRGDSLLNGMDSDKKEKEKDQNGLAYVCYGLLFVSILVEALPWMTILLKFSSVIMFFWCTYKLLHFDQWGKEVIHLKQFFTYLAYLILELIIENFLVWTISAVDLKKSKRLSPLQDNIALLVSMITQHRPQLLKIFNFKWVHTTQFLSISVLLALSPLWNQVPYSGFQMMSRFLLTCVISRSVRCVCFMLTVLPNPKPGCYMKRFPPVPQSFLEFLTIGFQKMKGTGGCNDLIFSGHCALWTLTPLLYHSYYKSKCCWLLWLALIQTSTRTVLEHHHYSVDMFLAVVITTLVWRELEWVCPRLQRQSFTNTVSRTGSRVLSLIVVSILSLVILLILKSGA